MLDNLMTSEEFDESILTNKDLNNALNQKSNQTRKNNQIRKSWSQKSSWNNWKRWNSKSTKQEN